MLKNDSFQRQEWQKYEIFQNDVLFSCKTFFFSSNIKTLETKLLNWQFITCWILQVPYISLPHWCKVRRQTNIIPSRSYPAVFRQINFFCECCIILLQNNFKFTLKKISSNIKTLETQLWIWQLIISWILHVFNIYCIDANLKDKKVKSLADHIQLSSFNFFFFFFCECCINLLQNNFKFT